MWRVFEGGFFFFCIVEFGLNFGFLFRVISTRLVG